MREVTHEPVRLIAGSGRSGTTWVLDALAEANALRPVFEPLHPLAIPQARPFAYRYFRPESEQAAAQAFLTTVFDGTFRSWWTDYRVRPDRLRPGFNAIQSVSALHEYFRRWRKLYRRYRQYAPGMRRRGLLVKVIRANLMLAWIRARFDARIVLVLRHPGAVVESRLRLGGEDWEPQEQLQRYLAQTDLQRDYLFKYDALLHGPLSAAQAHTAIWCIENQLFLTESSSGAFTVAFYEHLLSGQSESWRSVVDSLALEHLPDQRLLANPSQSARVTRSGTFDSGEGQRWHERLTPTIRREISEILRAMDVTIYDVDDPMPRTGALQPGYSRPGIQETS